MCIRDSHLSALDLLFPKRHSQEPSRIAPAAIPDIADRVGRVFGLAARENSSARSYRFWSILLFGNPAPRSPAHQANSRGASVRLSQDQTGGGVGHRIHFLDEVLSVFSGIGSDFHPC